jgi:hypothetical protein
MRLLMLGALTIMLSLLADPPGNTPSELNDFEKAVGFTEAFYGPDGKRFLRGRNARTGQDELRLSKDFHGPAAAVARAAFGSSGPG